MKKYLLLSLFLFLFICSYAQPEGFKEISKIKTTSVKDQAKAGSCWAFSAVSFIEAEVLKNTNKKFDLSENYTVYYAYIDKAVMFIRFHGNYQFSQGGQAHDVMNVIEKKGIVPESVYPYKLKDHSSLEKELKNYLDSIIKLDTMPDIVLKGYKDILNKHLGKPPSVFKYKGKNYTPTDFCSEILKFDVDNYIELTSFIHKKFYKPFVLEIPDNWSLDMYYNIPINEFKDVMETAHINGYSFVWDGDVSDPGFKAKKAIAHYVPDKNLTVSISEQPYRQILFNKHLTTDDHLMHSVGLYKNHEGVNYYLIKNSWSENYGPYDGYLYMSESYMTYQTIAIMINKNAIPENIQQKLNLNK